MSNGNGFQEVVVFWLSAGLATLFGLASVFQANRGELTLVGPVWVVVYGAIAYLHASRIR
jgi:hypothetical protein